MAEWVSGNLTARISYDADKAFGLGQEDYYLPPISELMIKLGHEPVTFSESQNITPTEKANYEGKIIDNALKMKIPYLNCSGNMYKKYALPGSGLKYGT